MKRHSRLIAFLLTLAMLLGGIPLNVSAAEDGLSGSGTADNPYIIEDEADLRAIADNLNASYMLAGDISPKTWDSPITTGAFMGTLDGNGYTITLPAGAKAPLFGGSISRSGTITNLILNAPSVTISVNPYGGGLLTNSISGISGKVINCAVKGEINVTGSGITAVKAGGFSGRLYGQATNSYSAVTFTCEDANLPMNTGAFCHSVNNSTKLADCRYDSSLTEKAIGTEHAMEANCTGMTTADLKAAASAMNETAPEGSLPWRADNDGGYPVFAKHLDFLSGSASFSADAKEGETLSVSDDLTPADAVRTYQWYRVDDAGKAVLIEDATTGSYGVTSSDVGYTLRLVISLADIVGAKTIETASVVTPASTVTAAFNVAPDDAVVIVKNSAGKILSAGETSVTLPAAGTFSYFIGKDGYAPVSGTLTTAGENVTIPVALDKKKDVDWTSSEVYNMQIGNLASLPNFPTSTDDAVVRWAIPTGNNYSKGEPSNAVFIGDYLYVVGYSPVDQEDETICLKKIDPASGKVLGKTPLTSGTGYNYFLTASEDMIFIQEGTRVEAFDRNLQKLWQSEPIAAGQGLCPINYSDGFVYGGTCRSLDGAGFFCLSAADGSLVWFNPAELSQNSDAGHYWAGGCIVENYVIYGSDCGRLYVADKYTGEIVQRLDVFSGSTSAHIRSSIAYDEQSDTIYFTTTNGYLHSAKFHAQTGAVTNHKSVLINETEESGGFGGTTTATPVMYNGRVYVGSSKYFGVFNADTLENIYRVSHKLSTLRDMRLVADDQNHCVYVFTSYYNRPGSIVMFKDEAGQTAGGEAMDFASLTSAHVQYCASMPIFGPDGTIYMSNDVGWLQAIQAPQAYLTALSADVGTFTEEVTKSNMENELVVPAGTQSVALTPQASDGAEITVNGAPATGGKAQVTLNEGSATASITVKKESYQLTYTLNIREVSADTKLHVLTNTSNSITSGNPSVIGTYKDKDNVYVITNADKQTRLWLAAADSHSSLHSEILQGHSNYTSATNNNVYDGIAYSGRYFASAATYPLLIRVNVTAENNTVKSYYILAVPEAEYNETPYLIGLALNQTELSFTKLNTSQQLTAVPDYLGDASKAEALSVTWSSDNEAVATVDKDGNVTAIADGTAVITASGGSFSASCTVTVKKSSSGGGDTKPETKPVVISISYSEDGSFVKGKGSHLLDSISLSVSDHDDNGIITLDEAFRALHEKYYSGGASGYHCANGWIDTFWGDTSGNISYVLNHSWVSGPSIRIKNDDVIAAFAYQNTTDYSDLYTWFKNDSESASANTQKTFTVNGLSVMNSSERKDATAAPENAAVTVYDKDGKAINSLATKVDANGRFTVTFPSAGTYTVEVSGTCDYTCSAYGGGDISFSNAPVVPSRCTVTVTGGSSSSSSSTVSKEDGSEVTTVTADNGTTATVMKKADGSLNADVVLSQTAVDDAQKNNGVIAVPDLSIQAGTTVANSPVVKVILPQSAKDSKDANVTVELPVTKVTPGTVAILLGNDGTQSVIKTSVVTEKGVLLTVDNDTTVAIVDRSQTFTDVAKSSWASDAVAFVSARNIFNGTGNNSFTPNGSMTRGMMATVLHNLENNPKSTGALQFNDVAKGKWYAEGISWAASKGIISGYGNDLYKPDDRITREQLVVMLWNYAGKPESSHSLSGFNDAAAISKYAAKAMAWANEAGVIDGYSDQTLRPGNPATRAQVAQMLMNYLNQAVSR